MTPEQFRALLAANGGLTGHQILNPTTETTTTNRLTGEQQTTRTPTPNPRVRYTTPNGEITALQKEDGSFEVLDDPKGMVKAAGGAGGVGDKPIEVGGKLVKPDGKGGYVQVWPRPDEPAGEKPVEIGGRIVQRQPDGTYRT